MNLKKLITAHFCRSTGVSGTQTQWAVMADDRFYEKGCEIRHQEVTSQLLW